MAIHKWSEIKDKMEPERRNALDAEVHAELKKTFFQSIDDKDTLVNGLNFESWKTRAMLRFRVDFKEQYTYEDLHVFYPAGGPDALPPFWEKGMTPEQYAVERIRTARLHYDPETGEYALWQKTLVKSDDVLGGEAVFPNSRIAVRHIGGLANRGDSLSSILQDYPGLTEQDVIFAALYALLT